MITENPMKWYNYVACFFAGVFLIHIVPHLTHGFSLTNALGVLVSLGGGCLLLWAGRFSIRNPWAVAVVIAGIASVLIFAALHSHHASTATTTMDQKSHPQNAIVCLRGEAQAFA
jgi:hypothetical protein